jgi:hypothetical protein
MILDRRWCYPIPAKKDKIGQEKTTGHIQPSTPWEGNGGTWAFCFICWSAAQKWSDAIPGPSPSQEANPKPAKKHLLYLIKIVKYVQSAVKLHVSSISGGLGD